MHGIFLPLTVTYLGNSSSDEKHVVQTPERVDQSTILACFQYSMNANGKSDEHPIVPAWVGVRGQGGRSHAGMRTLIHAYMQTQSHGVRVCWQKKDVRHDGSRLHEALVDSFKPFSVNQHGGKVFNESKRR